MPLLFHAKVTSEHQELQCDDANQYTTADSMPHISILELFHYLSSKLLHTEQNQYEIKGWSINERLAVVEQCAERSLLNTEVALYVFLYASIASVMS